MITIILFIFMLLFGGCGGVLGLGFYYSGTSSAMPIIASPIAVIEPSPTFTFTPNHSKGEPSVTPTYTITPTATSTFTPDPFITPSADNVPCTIVIRQPPQTAPTIMATSQTTPGVMQQIDAHVAYCVTTYTPKVGEIWQIRLQAIELGMPIYNLMLTNSVGDTWSMSYNPSPPTGFVFNSTLDSITFIEIDNAYAPIITFMINSPDELYVTASASGEIHFGVYYGTGGAMWSAGGMDPFILTISE